MEHHTTERQGIFIDRTRVRATLIYGVCLLVALVAYGWFSAQHPQPPAADYYRPDPPMVDNSVRVEILSNNQLFSNNQTCIGVCR